MLIIEVPKKYAPERAYIVRVIFEVFLGLDHEVVFKETNKVTVRVKGDQIKKIIMPDYLFNHDENLWLTKDILPNHSIKIWEAQNENILKPQTLFKDIPVMYGDDPSKNEFFKAKDNIYLGLDIFGSSFFMLSRYEEYVHYERDKHDRFPVTESWAYKNDMLDRPIVNEYIEILWQCIKYLWPGFERKKRKYRMILSHDIDVPFFYIHLNPFKKYKNYIEDLIEKKRIKVLGSHFKKSAIVKKGSIEEDPYNSFDYIMDISEGYNLQSTFYFMTHGERLVDGNYNIMHTDFKNLMQRISKRGHDIGLHGSYNSYNNHNKIAEEFNLLKKICNELGIYQQRWGGRQHYLRWKVPYTWQHYEDSGLHYDSTLSFADHAGFRCGTCYEYPVFNLLSRQELNLTESPLIIMDGSLLNKGYMGLSHEDAFKKTRKLIDTCKKFNGDFTLLWHNNKFVNQKVVDLYLSILDYGKI